MRSMPRVLAALALGLITTSANAQSAVDTLPSGAPAVASGLASNAQRVRLTMSRETLRTDGRYKVEGLLVDANETRAIVQQDRHTTLDTVPMFTVAKVERYAGERDRPKMILAGAAGGAAVSLVIRGMANLTNGSRCATKCSSSLVPGFFYALPVAAGALVGLVCPSTRWTEVKRADISVGALNRHRLQLSSSIAFR